MLELAIPIIGGLIGLFIGGELLVKGAVAIAHRLGISHLVTGVVIVGAATSMPEMVASVEAALLGSPGIAWGNIVGSNIANSLLILGAAALVAPIGLSGVGKRDALVALAATLAIWAVAMLQGASIGLGILILAALVVYIVWRLRHPPQRVGEDEPGEKDPALPMALALLVGGVGLLVVAGGWLVTGAVELAGMAGVSETVIGLTIVAVGTSLPELAASVAAALKGRSELAIGNVLGSNIFNLLLIGGVTMTIAPSPVPIDLLDLEMPVLAVSAAALLLLCRFARRIGRGLGAVLLAGFVANTVVLFL